VYIELGNSQVDVQGCALSWEIGKELGDELARLIRGKWRGGGEEDDEEDH